MTTIIQYVNALKFVELIGKLCLRLLLLVLLAQK